MKDATCRAPFPTPTPPVELLPRASSASARVCTPWWRKTIWLGLSGKQEERSWGQEYKNILLSASYYRGGWHKPAKSSPEEAPRNKHLPCTGNPRWQSHLPLQVWLPCLKESLLHRYVSRRLHCGLGKKLSNTLVNVSSNKNNASFGAEIPHSNLRDGHTRQPLFSCCYFLL